MKVAIVLPYILWGQHAKSEEGMNDDVTRL